MHSPPNKKISDKEVVLLGLVAEAPIHAYGLEEKIRERSMEDWTTISKSSIYRLLQTLAEQGYIESKLEHEGQGATRRIQQITQAGLSYLGQGVLEQVADLSHPQNPFLVGLAFGHFAPRPELLKELQPTTKPGLSMLTPLLSCSLTICSPMWVRK